jgi:hypothetical protein
VDIAMTRATVIDWLRDILAACGLILFIAGTMHALTWV